MSVLLLAPQIGIKQGCSLFARERAESSARFRSLVWVLIFLIVGLRCIQVEVSCCAGLIGGATSAKPCRLLLSRKCSIDSV